MSHEGFLVVPAALRNAQASFDKTADDWHSLREGMLASWKFEDDSLGLLGRLADVISDYNSAVDTIAEKLMTGVQSMRSASDTLNIVAAEYEAQDEEYYAKFGWIESEMNKVS